MSWGLDFCIRLGLTVYFSNLFRYLIREKESNPKCYKKSISTSKSDWPHREELMWLSSGTDQESTLGMYTWYIPSAICSMFLENPSCLFLSRWCSLTRLAGDECLTHIQKKGLDSKINLAFRSSYSVYIIYWNGLYTFFIVHVVAVLCLSILNK